jgi:hypothetical protein
MSFVDRARRRIAVRLWVGVPLLIAVACASREADDLFDSTPGEPTGSPSGGRAPVGPVTSGGSPAVIPSSGGMPAVSPAETGGTGLGGAAASAGAPVGPPEPSGGTGAASGGGLQTGGSAMNGGSSTTGGGTTGGGTTGGGNAGGSSAGIGTGGKPSCQSDIERCDGMDNDCDGAADEGDTCPADCFGFGSLDSAYMFCLEPSTASAARSACNDAGMRLAWVETADENQFLLEHGAKLSGVEPGEVGHGEDQDQMRLGGTDQEEEGRWCWVADEPGPVFWQQTQNARQPWQGEVTAGMFANWSEERPNQDLLTSNENCLVMELEDGGDGNAGEWNDVVCSDRYPFVCEVP